MSTVGDSPQAADGPRVAEDAHFPAGTEGQVYYLHSGQGETDENHGVGPTEQKNGFGFMQNQKSERKIACVAQPH